MEIVHVLGDGRVWRGGGPLCLALIVLANVWIAYREPALEADARASLMMAPQTRSMGRPRYDWSGGEDPGQYWHDIPDARLQPLVIVSGMSQMLTINDPQPGDEIIVEHLDDALAPRGIRAFGLAAPNMNNEEALLYLLAASIDARTKPTTFVYAVCFDKFRNADLRPGLAHFLGAMPGLREAWNRVCDSRAARYPAACTKIGETADETSQGSRGIQEENDFEHRLRRTLGRATPMIRFSADLNAEAQLRLYFFRNWLFRIKPSSKRPMLKSIYQRNQEFLGLMADIAQQYSVTLVLYVIPFNSIADNPYVPEEYESFKSWLQRLASERALPFTNLEAVVPHDDWGFFNGGPDYKHFREHGHELTAAAVMDHFGTVLGKSEQYPADSAAAP